MNIYELTGQWLELLQMAEDPEVDDEIIEDTMESLEFEIEEKAEGYAKIIKSLEGQIDLIKSEKNRLDLRQKALQGRMQDIKCTLETTMRVTGKTKIKTPLFNIGIQKNGGRQPLILTCDDEQLPDEFVKIQKIKDDKAIREYLDSGQRSEFFYYGERGESLRIR